MLRHNEHLSKFLQLTELLHVLQVTLGDVRSDKFKKKKERKKKRKEIKKEAENLMTKLVTPLLPPIRW